MSKVLLPKSYKAAQVTKKDGGLEIVDVVWKDPESGNIVLKVLASGVCHSDAIVTTQGMPTGLPRIPGHEIVGDVVAVHQSEKKWKIGDRVGSGWHGGHCFQCDSCRRGDFVTCQHQTINGISADGGYAEYVTIRTEAVVKVPESMDPAEAAPLLCAGVTTFNSVRNMDVHPGDVVGVQGIGGLGHLAIQFCRQMGYHTVALSSSASKKSLAEELGAHDYLDGSKVDQTAALRKLGGAKVIVATAPSQAVISPLIWGLRPGGILLLLAVSDDLRFPTVPIVTRRLSVRGWPSGTAKDSEETLAFCEMSGIKCKIEKYPLTEVNEAFQSMMAGKARFRAVLIPN